jgi:hypothetical protein
MTVDNKMKLPRAAESFDQIAGKTHFQKTSYARELRAVGQALEAQHVFSLDLELKGGLYVVRGRVTAIVRAVNTGAMPTRTRTRTV